MTYRLVSAFILIGALITALVVRAATPDLIDARSAYQRGDLRAVIELLLPAEDAGVLDDTDALMQLALACEQARTPPRNRPHPCARRAALIMVKAAERGNPHAMFAASIGLMDTGAGRIGLTFPFADDGKRVDALMWTLLATHFAIDEELRRRASDRATQLARSLHQEWRGRESLAQRALRRAETRRMAFEARGLTTALTSDTCRLAVYHAKPTHTMTHQISAGYIEYAMDPDWRNLSGQPTRTAITPSDCEEYCEDELGGEQLAHYCIESDGPIARFDFIDTVGNFHRMELDCAERRLRPLLSGQIDDARRASIGDDAPDPRWRDDTDSSLYEAVCLQEHGRP